MGKELMDMNTQELSIILYQKLTELKGNLLKGVEGKGNKSAQARARKALVELEKIGKVYRKISVAEAYAAKAGASAKA